MYAQVADQLPEALKSSFANMQDTQNQMGAMQDYIRSQQKDQLNIPALQFAAGLLKPTKTGSFAESVGEAGEGALGALQKQRSIDLDRQAKIIELQQGKSSLLNQQIQMLMPMYQMGYGRSLINNLHGPAGADASGSAPTPSGGAPDNEASWDRLGEEAPFLGETGKSLSALYNTHERFNPNVAGSRALQEHLNSPYKWLENGTEVAGTFGQYLQKYGKMPGTTPTAAPPPAPNIAPPSRPTATASITGPVIDPESGNVKSFLPPPPPGGGLPIPPPGATGLPPGYEKQIEAAAEVPKEWAKDSADLDTMKNRFRELNYLGKVAESNQWATQKAAIAAHLKALKLQIDPKADVSDIDPDKWGKPAEVQQEVKDVTQLAMAAARAQSSRGTNMVLQEAMLTTPQADMQPAARWTLINHGIATIDRRQQMIADWQAAQTKGWKDPNVFEQMWLKANPIDKWIQATSEKAGNFAGMPLPDKLRAGVLYVAPKGSKHAGELGVWNGKSFDTPDANDLTGMGAN